MLKEVFVKFLLNILNDSLTVECEYEVNQPLIYFFGLLGALTPFSYTVVPNQKTFYGDELFIFFAKLVRPQLFLNNLETIQSLMQYICYFGILLTFINIVLKGMNTQILAHDYHKFKMTRKVLFFMNQIFDVWLFNVIVEVLLLHQTAYNYIISSIYFGILIYRIAFTKVSIIFKYHTFNHQNQSIYYTCSQILNITQILLFVQGFSQFFVILQVIVSILICILNITNILIHLPQTNLNLLKLQLHTYLNSLIFCFGVLIIQFNDTENHNPQLIFIILWPLWIKISQYQFENLLLYSSSDLKNFQNKIIHIFFQNQGEDTNIKKVFYRKNLSQKLLIITQLQQLNLKKSNSKILEQIKIEDQLQYFSLLLLFEDYYGAYEYIQKNKKFQSMIQQIKFDICSLKCKLELKQQMNIFSQTVRNKVFNLDILNFIKVENQSQQLSEQLIQNCKQKIKFLQLFTQNKIKKAKLERHANYCIQIFEENIQLIEQLYKQFPLKRYQRCLTFAYAELCNDFLQAIRVLNLTSFNDEAIYTKILSLSLDFYSIKTIYLITNLENRQIIKLSSNYHNVMKNKIQNLQEIIPRGIKDYHEEMIINFLRTGESSFFQETTSTFYQNEDFIQPITIINDVFIQNNQINSITIATISCEDSIVLIVDESLCIVGITKGFLDSLEINHEICKYFYGIQIELVIPQFVELSKNDQAQYLELRFLSGFQLQKYVSSISKNFISKQQQQILIKECWKEKSKTDIYISHCNIIKSKYGFYKIMFNYIKNEIKVPYRSQTLKTYAQIAVHDKDDLDEQVKVIIPYESQEFQQENQDAYNIHKSEVLASVRDHQTLALIDIDKDIQLQQVGSNHRQTIIKPLTLQNVYQSQKELIQEKDNQSYSINEDDKKQFYSIKNIQKYGIFEKVRQISNLSRSQKLLISILILNQVLFFIQILLSMISSLNILNQNNVDIDLLQIKYYLFQPIESFIVTRYTIINYNAQYSAKSITKSQLDKYLIFPNSNLNLGFDDVQQNQAAILNRLTLQEFLGQYYDFYIYIKTDIGELYNITMRQALSILINYQYTFKAAYKYDGKTVSDSPYIFYSYRNLLTLYNSFDLLNQDLYLQTNLTIQLDISKELKLFYPFLILQVLFLALEIYCYYYNDQYLNKFFFLFLYCDTQVIQYESKRLNQYIELYHNKSEQILSFQFKIEAKESEVTDYKENSIISSLKSSQKQRTTKMTIKNRYIILLFQTIILISFGLLQYFVMQNYLNKYKPTCEFYLQMSYLGTNIPTIYAMREVLYYRWRYPFYKNEELSQILLQVETSLQQIQNITVYLQQIQMDQYILSQNFYLYLEKLSNNNLCEVISMDLIERSKDFCFQTLGGSLQKGLQGALVFIYSSMKNEQQINSFLNKTENTVNELEGVFIITEIIKQANLAFKVDFLSQAQLVQDSLIIISIIYLIFLMASVIIILVLIHPYLQKQLYYSRRYLFLIPQIILYGDDAFERQIKVLMNIQF
ncbi:unnamed protein product [Paramecium sonneborni]|uniref:Transmembrane protein n=1 Tax=Paramecium sonneborni TaxID=65129 RepID=A0A8S1PP56_9CILI|nr:unnamed protein product [Paramecium sonneborni]